MEESASIELLIRTEDVERAKLKTQQVPPIS